jgi:hypothetical protein
VAVDYLEQGEQQDAEFLAKLRPKASRLALADGEKKTVALTLVER